MSSLLKDKETAQKDREALSRALSQKQLLVDTEFKKEL